MDAQQGSGEQGRAQQGSARHDQAPAQQRGALRYRSWQRLRGQRAFLRERNVGVYRHSAAALIRILPPWDESEQSVQGGAAASTDSAAGAGSVASTSLENGAKRTAAAFPTGRRLGVVASRKVGNAVVRNRAKRLWREIFRLNQHVLPVNCDVLVIVRKGFADASRADLEALFADVTRRARKAFGSR